MRRVGLILLFFILYLLIPACGGSALTGDSEENEVLYDADSFDGTSGGSDSEADSGAVDTGAASPVEEEGGIDIPITIGKATLPSIDGRYLKASLNETTAGIWGIRQAYAESGNIHLKCLAGCVDMSQISEGVGVVIESLQDGQITQASLNSDGSFSADINASTTDTFSISLAGSAGETGTPTEITFMGTDSNGNLYIDIALTTDDTDKEFLFGSHEHNELGVILNADGSSTKIVAKMPLAGGEITNLFSFTQGISSLQWSIDGSWISFLGNNQAWVKYDVATDKTQVLASPPPLGILRRVSISPDSVTAALSDNSLQEPGTPFKIIDMTLWQGITGFILDEELAEFNMQFTPNGKNLVVIGTKPFPSKQTFIFVVSNFEKDKEPLITELFKGPLPIIDWEVSADNLGVFYATDDGNDYFQIFYKSFNPKEMPVPLTSLAGYRDQLTVSKTGKWLAYRFWLKGEANSRIFAIDLTQASPEETPLTNDPINPYFSPLFAGEANSLYYLSKDAEGYTQVFVKNPDNLNY